MSQFNFFKKIDKISFLEKNEYLLDDTITLKINRSYYYKNNGITSFLEEKNLDGDDSKTVFMLQDEKSNWDEEKFYLDIDVAVENIENLFEEKTGYVNRGAKIGIGLEWRAKKSRIKKYKKIGTINDSKLKFISTSTLDLVNTRNDIVFTIKFYIEEGSKALSIDNMLPNQKGLVLASFDFLELKFRGEGSEFPIYEISNMEKPLYGIHANFKDIYEDEFTEENISIYLNKAHKDYQYIDSNSHKYNPVFEKEVLSSALFSLIIAIKEKDDFRDLANEDLSNIEGTIAYALRYYSDILDIALFDDATKLLESIKIFFDRRL